MNKHEQCCYLRAVTEIPLWRENLLYANLQREKTVDAKKSKSCEADVSSDLRKEVESHYKLSLPEDFYHFWKFCEELDPEKPAGELFQNHSPASAFGKDSGELNQRSKQFIEKKPFKHLSNKRNINLCCNNIVITYYPGGVTKFTTCFDESSKENKYFDMLEF